MKSNVIAALARSRGMVREAEEYERYFNNLVETQKRIGDILDRQRQALLQCDENAVRVTIAELEKASCDFRQAERRLSNHSLPVILARQTEVLRHIGGTYWEEVPCG